MKELERFKIEVNLVEYAMSYGYNRLDRNKSCKTCTVLRRREDDGKIAVMRGHDDHWVYYDFRRGEGGSVLDFVMQHKGCNLGQARKELRTASNINSLSSPTAPFFEPRPATKDRQKAAREYADTNFLTKHHVYLAKRGIYLKDVINKRFLDMVRVDQRKNLCFPYLDFDGVAGLELRNFNFKGYTQGGSKGLWRSNLMKDDTCRQHQVQAGITQILFFDQELVRVVIRMQIGGQAGKIVRHQVRCAEAGRGFNSLGKTTD